MAKHEFTVGDKTLKVIRVTPEIRMESQKYFAKALNEAMENGILLRAEMEEHLANRGLLDSVADEAKAAQIRKAIKDLEIQLRQGIQDGRRMTKEEGKKIALQIREERAKLREIGTTVSNLLSNTAESYANNEQMQYFLYACTVDAKSGQRYWPTYESFKADTDSEAYAKSTGEFLSMMTGVDKDYERKLYEHQWLIKMKFMNEDLQLIDDQGRLVDSEGRLINKDGRFINANGDYVDIYGNPIDETGNLLIADTWGVTDTPKPETKVVEGTVEVAVPA
jgi:hypothetical protein